MNALAHGWSIVRSGRAAKIAISTGIIAYFTVALAWIYDDNAFKGAILDWTRGPWMFFGFHQYWHLFAPGVRTYNYNVCAVISFADGTSTIWQLPHPMLMNHYQKFAKDKFRKWGFDNLPFEDTAKEYWPDLARYIGRLHCSPDDKPISCTLLMLYGDIPPPGKTKSRFDLPPHTQSRTIFDYQYQPEDIAP